MKEYDHKKLEKKWQAVWEKKKIYCAQDPSSRAKLITGQASKKKKFYALIEFPYPSGDGLHVGHPRPYIGMDIISRKRRMQGFNVLYPIGWDAFGLPTENYAIKTGQDPRVVTKKNTDTFRRQIKSLGISFDWSREINTTDPKYYKWTQWIFLQFLKKGLAYKAKMTINWCPSCKIGLANEEVVDGKCERCGTPAEKREKEQWILAITKYADRLYKDLDEVDYLPQIKLGQRNWIGRSEGAQIKFSISNSQFSIEVFTTRADTLFGATYLVLAPEHELVSKLKTEIKNWNEVEKYIAKAKKKNEIDRGGEGKEKTGVELKGVKAINPATKEEIPIWIADYVLVTYGTGAIMAVPAHDERDFEFAKKFNLLIKYVVAPYFYDDKLPLRSDKKNVPRMAVNCFVRNPKDNTYLCIEWNKSKGVNWRTVVSGGVEDGEDIIKAGKREVEEETGYKNLKFIKYLGSPCRVDFYHPPKDENRLAHFTGLLFELENNEQSIVDDFETAQHSYKWIKEEKVLDFISHARIFFVRILNNDVGAYTGDGKLINSGEFSEMDSEKAKKEIVKFVGAKEKVTFKLRDWIFSRQRYWGEPIPVINCGKCGLVPVPEKDLPVMLPKVKNYQPTDSGESPLANISKWVNVKCPKCKGKARRETDTMPNWAGSSWYYLRYTDPKNNKEFASKKNLNYWLGTSPQPSPERRGGNAGGVDWYNGGNEHTTLHLLYSRFWHKFLFDLKLVPTSEPYMKRTSHGLILAEGGEKMSKSKGNVINPDDIVQIYGADTLRLYEMFMGPFDQAIAWSEEAIIGPRRFLERVWKMSRTVLDKNKTSPQSSPERRGGISSFPFQGKAGDEVERLLHKTIKKVSEDIESMHFNTAISSMMILANEMQNADSVSVKDFKIFLQLLSPFAPHITEELWQKINPSPDKGRGRGGVVSIHLSDWPKYDENLTKDEEMKIVVQINGKVRAEIMIQADEPEEAVKKKALLNSVVAKWTSGQNPKKMVYVKNRLINIVL